MASLSIEFTFVSPRTLRMAQIRQRREFCMLTFAQQIAMLFE
jgi:hypothetical protein